MQKAFAIVLGALFVLLIVLIGVAKSSHHGTQSGRTDRAMTGEETASVNAAIALMTQHRLENDATLASDILKQGKWRAAAAQDAYLRGAEKAGDTPFAYTLSNSKNPDAIVLAPRFFKEATPTGRAAIMIHEMGHYRAYQRTGKSDEFDGYRAEYDEHKQIGLTEKDGIVYFGLLDGVMQYVVPRLPAYKNYPDVKDYIAQAGN